MTYGNTTVMDARAPRQGGADRRTPDTQCDRQDYRTAAKANRIVPIYTFKSTLCDSERESARQGQSSEEHSLDGT